MGNPSNILQRAVESMTIGADSYDPTTMVFAKGSVKITSKDTSLNLADGADLQKASDLSFAIKGTALTTSGGAVDMSYTSVSAGQAEAGGLETGTGTTPTHTYVDLGFVNKGKFTLSATPVFFQDAAQNQLIQGKNIALALDMMETAAQSFTSIEALKGLVSWFKILTQAGDTFKLPNVRPSYTTNLPFEQGSISVIGVSAKRFTKKLVDTSTPPSFGVVFPTNLQTLVTKLEGYESTPQTIVLTCVDGSTHTLTGVYLGVGISFDFSADGNPTFDISGTRHTPVISSIYTIG